MIKNIQISDCSGFRSHRVPIPLEWQKRIREQVSAVISDEALSESMTSRTHYVFLGGDIIGEVQNPEVFARILRKRLSTFMISDDNISGL